MKKLIFYQNEFGNEQRMWKTNKNELLKIKLKLVFYHSTFIFNLYMLMLKFSILINLRSFIKIKKWFQSYNYKIILKKFNYI